MHEKIISICKVIPSTDLGDLGSRLKDCRLAVELWMQPKRQERCDTDNSADTVPQQIVG